MSTNHYEDMNEKKKHLQENMPYLDVGSKLISLKNISEILSSN